MSPPDPLKIVRRASRDRRRAVAAYTYAYREAVLAAAEAGCSHAQIARAAGVSRQAVRELVARARGEEVV